MRVSTTTLIVLICLTAASVSASIWTAPLSSTAQQSTTFKVTANGQPISVEHFRDRHLAHFSADAACDIVVTTPDPIGHASIHPASFKLTASIKANTLSFQVSPSQFEPEPTYLIIKIDELENLVLLIDPPGQPPPEIAAGKAFSVIDAPFLADASGKQLATRPIQDAIDAASNKGGGVVLVPAGNYRVQTLSLRSSVTLYLQDGAVIRGSTNLADFDTAKLPAVVQISNFKDVTICGHGSIDASDDAFLTPNGLTVTVVERGSNRRNALRVTNGTNLTLEGITTRDAATWSIDIDRVNGLHISRMKVLGPMWALTDGFDIDARNALIDKCFAYTGDDDFCCKASHLDFPVANVRFTDCIAYGNSAGVKVGMQAVGEQQHISFQNIDVVRAGRGIVVEHLPSASEHDPQPIEDIAFTDIRIEQVEGVGGTSRNPIQINSAAAAPIRDLRFTRIQFGNFGPKTSLIRGYDDEKNKISQVIFNDLFIAGQPITSAAIGQIRIDNANGVEFHITPKAASRTSSTRPSEHV